MTVAVPVVIFKPHKSVPPAMRARRRGQAPEGGIYDRKHGIGIVHQSQALDFNRRCSGSTYQRRDPSPGDPPEPGILGSMTGTVRVELARDWIVGHSHDAEIGG